LRADSAALLCKGSRRLTRCVRFAHYARTGGGESVDERAGARRPLACAARRPGKPRPPPSPAFRAAAHV